MSPYYCCIGSFSDLEIQVASPRYHINYRRPALAFIGFSIISHFYPGAQHNNFWYRYQALGSSPGEAIVNLIIHPWLFFTTFVTLNRLYYLASLFRSTGFLSLLAPEWLLLALPGLAINLLSTDPSATAASITTMPVLFLSSCFRRFMARGV